ncbi:hypothetical protein RRG08_046205 [Elysia crispata]|uniref:Uncharacterized protein n=1 Tax=Elysia crispata TaxID=231223 RepID=A0AAE0XNC6_9GAST|nr:hypothetical protein RRG08_046205 [Elysia crispata]
MDWSFNKVVTPSLDDTSNGSLLSDHSFDIRQKSNFCGYDHGASPLRMRHPGVAPLPSQSQGQDSEVVHGLKSNKSQPISSGSSKGETSPGALNKLRKMRIR